jgi:hypothetical protein
MFVWMKKDTPPFTCRRSSLLASRALFFFNAATATSGVVSLLSNQYISSVPGSLPAGKEKPNEKYNGRTIFVNHASSYIHLTHQVSLQAGEKLKSKLGFKHIF